MFGSKRRRAQGEEAQIKQAIENAQRVVQAYGAELEKSADQEIRNSGNLPFDENVIKNAIILLCKLTDDKKYREILIEGYVSLSSYQPLTKEASNLLDMFPDFSPDIDLKEFKNMIEGRGDKIQSEMKIYSRWSLSVTKKMESLYCELCGAGIIDEEKRDRFLAMFSEELRSGKTTSNPSP